MRQEITGVIEKFSKMGLAKLTEFGKDSTGVLDAVRNGEEEFLYCEMKHRNGECRLPGEPEN